MSSQSNTKIGNAEGLLSGKPVEKQSNRPKLSFSGGQFNKFNHEQHQLEKLYAQDTLESMKQSRLRKQEKAVFQGLMKNLKVSGTVNKMLHPDRRETLFTHEKESMKIPKLGKATNLEKLLKPVMAKPIGDRVGTRSDFYSLEEINDGLDEKSRKSKLKHKNGKFGKNVKSVNSLGQIQKPDSESSLFGYNMKEVMGITKPSTSFQSFNHENLTWEEHLFNNLSRSTAEWLVLEKTSGEQRTKYANLMRMNDNQKNVQLVRESVSNKDLKALETEQEDRRIEAERYQQNKTTEMQNLKLHPETTLGMVVRRSNNNQTGVGLGNLDHGNNYTAEWVEKSLNTDQKIRKLKETNSNQKSLENLLDDTNRTIQILKNSKDPRLDDQLVINKNDEVNKFDLVLEEKFPPNNQNTMNKFGFRRWMDSPKKFSDSDIDMRKTMEGYIKDHEGLNESAISDIDFHRKKEASFVEEPKTGPYQLLKEWARQLHFNVSWTTVSCEEISDLLLDIHESANLQAILFLLLAITSQNEIDFPESLINLARKRVLKSPRYQMTLKLFDILQDKDSIESILSNLLPDLEAHDKFFISQFMVSLDVEIPEKLHNQLIENLIVATFDPEKYLTGTNKTRLIIKRVNKQLIKECKKNTSASRVIVTICGERLQSVRQTERCLALTIISSCGTNAENISHCVLERMNHLLWNDPSLEVRQQACITLEKLNANHIVYQDLLVKFKNLQFTNSESENLEKQPSQESFENPKKSPEQNRSLKKPSIDSQDKLWCLSVVRQLKIMTAQLLPCYINCFEEKDHADVRLLSCHVANDLKLTSSRVYDCLMVRAQNDSADHVKAAAIEALTNFNAAPEILKMMTWAARFENNWIVRLASVNSLGKLNGIRLEGMKESQDCLKSMRERAIIESNFTVKTRIRTLLKEQLGIECKDSDLKELKQIKEQVSSLCTKEKILELMYEQA